MALTATASARTLLEAIGADAVLGGGGYVAGPVGLAAWSLRVPLVLTEADSHLGVTNRLLAPLARRVFLAFPIAGRDGDRFVVAGRPVPAGTVGADRAAARARFGIAEDEPCVLVFGGSLGARRLNLAALEAFGEAAPGAVLHASGRRDHADLVQRLAAIGSPAHYHLHAYVEPFADALAAADLVAARAGGSVLEVAAAGLPSILIPYPHATADHQSLNARHMERRAPRWWCPTPSSTERGWRARWVPCSRRPQRMAAMAKAARGVARPDAAGLVAKELLDVSRRAGRRRARRSRD